MRWPVSRTAYDAVASERDYLREQLAQALDHNRRIERVEAGRPEVPVQHKQPREPMPDDVKQAIGGWEGDSTRMRLEAEAYRRAERDGGWDGVRTDLAAS